MIFQLLKSNQSLIAKLKKIFLRDKISTRDTALKSLSLYHFKNIFLNTQICFEIHLVKSSQRPWVQVFDLFLGLITP